MGVYELRRNVLKADLKESIVRILRRESGSSIQAFGAATDITQIRLTVTPNTYPITLDSDPSHLSHLFFFRTDYMDSPDCLLILVSTSVFLLFRFSVLHFLVVGSVR